MLSESIRKWNPWWGEGKVPEELIGVPREKLKEIEKASGLGLVKDITGMRRCGKSFLLHQLIQKSIDSGIKARDIVLLNFDDNDVYGTEFSAILDGCEKINPGITHVFLDEVQEKKGWERWVRTLHDTKRFREIFITGSSASILNTEISRVLTGRHTGFVLFPFSFREFLKFHGWKDFGMDYLNQNRGKVLHFLERYIKEGGFPETLGKSDFERNKYLNGLFDDIVARDVAARYKADYEIAKRIAYYVMSHSSKTMTHRSIARSCGVSTDTVSKYIHYMTECFLILTLRRFSPKLKEQMREINKHYSADTGLSNAAGYRMDDEFARLMENCVMIELKRRFIEDPKKGIFYWQDSGQKEVDFVIKDGPVIKELVQVCYDTQSEKAGKRETAGMVSGMEQLRPQKATMITWNREGEEKTGHGPIVYVPLWKWLLSRTEDNM